MVSQKAFKRPDKLIANLSLVILIIWTSFIFNNKNGDPGFAIRHLGMSLFCFFFLAYFFIYRQLKLPQISRLQLLGLVSYLSFSLVGIISAFLGVNAIEGIFPFLINVNLVLLICISMYMFSNGIDIKFLSFLITVIGGISGSFGILQYYDLVPDILISGAPPTALQFNRNFFGSSQVLVLPFASTACIYLNGRNKYISITCLAIVLTSIAVSETRSAVLSLLIFGFVVILAVVTHLRRSATIKINKKLVWSAIALAIIAGLVLGHNYFNSVSNGLNAYLKSDNPFRRQSSIEERLTIWEGSIDILKSSSVYGVGFGNWKIHYANNPYQPNRVKSGRVVLSKAHNVYLEILCETGIIGFLAYAGFVLIIFKILISSSIGNSYVFLFGAGFLAYLSDYFFSFGNYQPTHMVYSGLMIGFIMSLSGANNNTKSSIRIPKLAIYLGLCVTVIAVYWTYSFMIFEQHIEKSQDSSANKEFAQAHYQLNNAIKSVHPLNRHGDSPHLQQALVYNQEKKFDEALESLNKAWADHPYSPRLNATFGRSYFSKGQLEKASFYYQKAFDIQSTNKRLAEELAVCYFQSGKYKDCVNVLEKFDGRLDPSPQMMLKIARFNAKNSKSSS